jgi:hypothetical protein
VTPGEFCHVLLDHFGFIHVLDHFALILLLFLDVPVRVEP